MFPVGKPTYDEDPGRLIRSRGSCKTISGYEENYVVTGSLSPSQLLRSLRVVDAVGQCCSEHFVPQLARKVCLLTRLRPRVNKINYMTKPEPKRDNKMTNN